MAMVWLFDRYRVCPSGLAALSNWAAIWPPAPGLLSTTTGWPSSCCRPWASWRAIMSELPPAAKPTRMRMLALFWARAVPVAPVRASARAPSRKWWRFMDFLSRGWVLLSENLAGVHQAQRVQGLLDLPHHGQFGRAAAQAQVGFFVQADAMLGRHAAAMGGKQAVDQFFDRRLRLGKRQPAQRARIGAQVQVAVAQVAKAHAALAGPAQLQRVHTGLGKVTDHRQGQADVEIDRLHAGGELGRGLADAQFS